MRVGIVSMMREPGAVLTTFVNYHRNIGFTDFIILFDDPEDPDLALARTLDGVIPIPVDHTVRQAWQSLKNYEHCKDHVDQTVGARQLLNIEYGFNVALEAGIDWLLHIDIDELFYINKNDLAGHLQMLESTGKEAAAYYNYEAVPESLDIDNYFQQVSIFKKPIKLLQKQNIRRRGIWPPSRRYFNFYNNGKSIVRVMPGVCPLGAHRWTHAERELERVVFFNPCILHYSVCGYKYFEQKYRHRGNFSDIRIDKDLRQSGAELDLDARDAFMTGNEEAAKKLYEQRVMMDPSTRDRMLEAGILRRIDLQHLLKI
jgi:hypothetical protein